MIQRSRGRRRNWYSNKEEDCAIEKKIGKQSDFTDQTLRKGFKSSGGGKGGE